MNPDADGACPGRAEILDDLAADNLLQLQPGERMWKLYCFRTPDHATALRHRIYTKLKTDGRLALVTFAAHDIPTQGDHDGRETGEADSAPASAPIRSGVARVTDLSAHDLNRVIAAMRQSDAAIYEEVDLSDFETLEDQMAWLRENS